VCRFVLCSVLCVCVCCPQDRTIAVWDMKTPKDVVLRRVLVGHRAAVNVVDFDERYIVSASGDRTIKVSHHLAHSALLGLRVVCKCCQRFRCATRVVAGEVKPPAWYFAIS